MPARRWSVAALHLLLALVATRPTLTHRTTLPAVSPRLRAAAPAPDHAARITANQDPELVERTARERPAILEALGEWDGDRAARIMEEHIDGVRRKALRRLDAAADVPE